MSIILIIFSVLFPSLRNSMGFTNLSVLTRNMPKGLILHLKLSEEFAEKLEIKIIKRKNLHWIREMTVKVMQAIIKLLLWLLI